MELQLRYNKHTQLPASAAFLHGDHTVEWLKQISRWGIDAGEFSCYIIPTSINKLKPAGLFVIFNNAAITKDFDLLHPYRCIGKRLFIPCNTTLFPYITNTELDQLLLWHLQVFHPSIGLVGFEENTSINIADLFIYPTLKNTCWSFADPGLADKPPFTQIIVTPPSVDEVMKEIKTDIHQKPIEDIIPDSEKKNPLLEKLLNIIKLVLFLPLLALLKLFGLFSIPLTGNYSRPISGKPGLLQQFQTWIEKNLDELQKKRDKELKRLSDLFDKDTNEALQFAIPLNSPYLDRGKQAALSSSLFRRLTQFNLGGLGGGTAVDAWDLGNHYHSLRTKYLNAAEKEIQQKDFKKAAYVYAHLLGDYYNAAKVLEQGNFYREAATLHKDHQKNIPAAAQCLERGGLYSEAIGLYKDLKEDEKIGDLYRQMQQENNAQQYYEYCVERKIESDNLLDAARVVHEKMQQEERARELLLQGWKGNYQHELCLKKYFDLIIEKEEQDIDKTVNHIYREHTAERKELPLLNVLEYVNAKSNNKTVLHASQEIAYEILHKEAVKGNTQTLHNLKKFLPNNKLIGSDTSRFASSNARKSLNTIPPEFKLDQTIRWKKTTSHRNQFIAVGIKNKQLHMARANWYGNIEYYSWETEVEDHNYFNFITAPFYSNHIILHSASRIPIARRVLPKNKYFADSLVVSCPVWLHKFSLQFLIDNDNKINKLEGANGEMTIHRYTMQGVLVKSVNCVVEDRGISLSAYYTNPALVMHDGFYYSYTGSVFLTISPKGSVLSTDLCTGIRMFAGSEYSNDFFLIVSTNKGCSLCKPDKEDLNYTGTFFAEEMIPLSIVFIAANRFVIAEKMKAVVFEITNDKPNVIGKLYTHAVIAGVLPVPKRDSLAILEENGSVSVYDIDKL